MCSRTFVASSSYLNVKPQSLGNVYDVVCSGTAMSAKAAAGAKTVPVATTEAAVCKKSRRPDAAANASCFDDATRERSERTFGLLSEKALGGRRHFQSRDYPQGHPSSAGLIRIPTKSNPSLTLEGVCSEKPCTEAASAARAIACVGVFMVRMRGVAGWKNEWVVLKCETAARQISLRHTRPPRWW